MKLLTLDSSIKNPALNPKLGDINIQNTQATLQSFLTTGINLAFGVGGIITFFMLLIGAIEYITSGGDKENVEKAKKKISSALIGLVLLFCTYAIVSIIGGLFGVNLFNFSIPTIANS